MNKTYTFAEFIKIIEMLRGDEGCPWDREQTHESLRPCMTEEAAELLASIRIYAQTGSPENMKEELGDVLLQVVMHSQIAAEEGIFTFEDVVQEISEKMVRRHPHVFGDTEAENSAEVLKNWEEIKGMEKQGKPWIGTPLREIPVELPALAKASKVLKKAGKIYGSEETAGDSVQRFQAVAEGLSVKNMGQALPQILLETVRLCNICGISAEQALSDLTEEIIEQYEPKQ